MTYVYRFTSLALVLLGLLAGACSKKDDPATVVTTGSLSGTVAPVGSITQVTAKNSGGLTFVAKPDAASGAFSLADLAAGPYTLSSTAASGYKPVADRTLNIVAGQNTAVGTVQATSDGTIKSGSLSWTVNGQTYTTTVVSGLLDRQASGSFSLVGKSTAGNQVDEVDLGVGQSFNGINTYPFNSAYNSAVYQRTTGGTTTFRYRSGGGSSSNGSIIVTQYDAAAGTAAGTFGFVGVPDGAGTGTATITNGSFNIRF